MFEGVGVWGVWRWCLYDVIHVSISYGGTVYMIQGTAPTSTPTRKGCLKETLVMRL